MNEMTKELHMSGYNTAEDVFRHGLHCLESSRQSLQADRDNPIKYQMNRIVNDMHDIQIAENILREWYGIQFADISTHRGIDGLRAHVWCGIEELAKALGTTPKEVKDWDLKKTFSYDWCEITQLAERHSTGYKKAFDGNPKDYSTTYEKAYGENHDRI